MDTNKEFLEKLNKKRKNENSSIPDIDIVCPNCKKKASYFADKLVGSYVVKPSNSGKISCLNCGLARDFNFTNKDYFYKIEIGNRYLYARTIEHLKFLKEYFQGNKEKNKEPTLDFPKLFYERKIEIVNKICKIIESQK